MAKGFQKGHIVSEETRRKIGIANRGRKYGIMPLWWRQKISLSLKGKMPKFIPDNHGHKLSAETIRKRTENRIYATGKEHWNWKGGITPKNHKIRTSTKYKYWRISVFKKDNYTCIWCGQVGGKLQVDHIKPFSLFPKLRFKISNGRTLCIECHRKTDTHSSKMKTYAENH